MPVDDTLRKPNYLLPILLIVALLVLLYGFNSMVQKKPAPQPAKQAQPTIIITDTIFGATNEQQVYLFSNQNLGLVATTAPKTLTYDQQLVTLRENLDVTNETSLSLVEIAQRDPYELTLPNGDTIDERLSGSAVRFSQAVVTGAEVDLLNYLNTLNRFYDRQRPIDVDPKLAQPDSRWDVHYEAAPSPTIGQVAYLTGLLARLDSARADEYRTLHINVMTAMRQAGVAFPRALNDGETIAERYVEKLFTNQQFTTQYNKAEAEWAAN